MAHVINGIFHFTYHVQHTCGVLVACVGPSWAVYPCTSAESPSYHAVSCNMQTGSFASPLHFQLTKCYQAQICICSVLKDGRAFLGTLALDSNCIVWCTCCVVFTLCALKLHIHPVDDCSFPFCFLFSFLISCFSIIWGIFCMTMQGGPGSTPAQLRTVAGPHISSCKLRPGTSILYNCWEHGVCLLQFSSHAVARPACPA